MKNKVFWDKNLAIKIANKKGIILSKIHWKIIYFYRNFYFKNKLLPNIKILLFYLNKNKNKYNSIYLFKLFPKGLIKQILDICGLSNKIVSCF